MAEYNEGANVSNGDSDSFDQNFGDKKQELVTRDKRPRGTSSSSSTTSKSESKRTKIGSLDEQDEDFMDSEEEEVWSEEEFHVTFKSAPDWAKGMMDFLKSSVGMLKKSSMAVKKELQLVKKQVLEVRKENQDKINQLEESVEHINGSFESWKEEKAVLLSQIAELKSEYELKFDEINQYSRRSCLILTGVKESRGENTDTIALEIFTKQLGVKIELAEIAKSHRITPRNPTDREGNVKIKPIIVKFASDRSRAKVFKEKKKLKGSGHCLFESLTSRRFSLMSEVKKIAGFKNVWTVDGNIFSFDKNGRIFNVKSFDDLRKVKPQN